MLLARLTFLLPLVLAGCGAAAPSYAPSVAGPRLASTSPLAGQVAVRATSSRRGVVAKAAPEAAAARTAPSTAKADERFIVRSAFMRLERRDPEAGPKAAGELAKQYGGWVQRTSNESATIMVPAERLDGVLEDLAKLGKVMKRDVRGEDVTEEYLDLRIRLDNLEKARARYLDLLAKAQSVTETLSVEKELERVTLQIEQLKGRVQYLERVVRFSTVDVHFERPTNPGPVGWVFYVLYYGVKWLFVWD
ncbi:MAG TPA: DUF4349 domain-containing protein [Polyangia bacterium]|jgi:ribosomal protein S19E (S16A)